MLDERILMHQLRSTSLAARISGVVMGGYALYQLLVHHSFRTEVIVFLSIMAAVKIGSMVYFHFFN